MQCSIPLYGEAYVLNTTFLEMPESSPELVVKSWAPYRRFAMKVADDGLDSFGLREGHYAVFREARWPERECSVCLVRFGEEVTVRLFEGVQATMVTLRVSGDRIPPVELEPTDFSVVGVLDGVVYPEFANVRLPAQTEFDWGC